MKNSTKIHTRLATYFLFLYKHKSTSIRLLIVIMLIIQIIQIILTYCFVKSESQMRIYFILFYTTFYYRKEMVSLRQNCKYINSLAFVLPSTQAESPFSVQTITSTSSKSLVKIKHLVRILLMYSRYQQTIHIYVISIFVSVTVL